MEIKELYNAIDSITKSSNKQNVKERMVVDAVEKYSSENKIKFEETLEQLDEFVNSLN